MIDIDLTQKKPNYHLFCFDNKKYILDYRNIFYAELSDVLYDSFLCIKENVDWEQIKNQYQEKLTQAQNTIEDLYKSNIFFSKEVSLEKPEYSEAFISLAPIHQCNLRCKYCFAEHGANYKEQERKFTEDILEKSFEYLYLYHFKDIMSFRIDFVSGGEPLLAFDVINSVIKICEKMDELYNKKTKYWLCTNGTVYNREHLEILNNKKFNIGISLDGSKESNDKFRLFENGESTYDTVVNNIQLILNDLNLSRNFKNIWGLVVITNKTDSLVDILKHYKTIGIKNVQMKFVRSENRDYTINTGNIDKLKCIYYDLFCYFIDNIDKGNIDDLKMILNDNDYFGKIIRRLVLRMVIANRCQASKNKISLAANGDMYPCDSFVGASEFKLGNAIHRTFEIKNICNIYCEDRESCSNCWARFICGGDCFHNSYLKNKSIVLPDDAFCKMEKYLIELAVTLLCYINTNKPDLYNVLKKTLYMEVKTR